MNPIHHTFYITIASPALLFVISEYAIQCLRSYFDLFTILFHRKPLRTCSDLLFFSIVLILIKAIAQIQKCLNKRQQNASFHQRVLIRIPDFHFHITFTYKIKALATIISQNLIYLLSFLEQYKCKVYFTRKR